MSFEFDPFSHAIHADPYPVYRVLRDEHPVYHNERYDFWALSRFADVQAAARDWRKYSNAAGVDLDGTGQQYAAGNFLDADPPRHDILRGVLRAHFVPKAIGALEHAVAEETARLLDRLTQLDEVDLIRDFAAPLPVAMIARLLGVPETDRDELGRWTRGEITRNCEDPTLPAIATQAVAEMREYFDGLVRERRDASARPDDLVSSMVEALEDGRLADAGEAADMCLLIATAGTETTTALLGSSLLALDREGDQRRLLQSGGVEAGAAVEELLRYDAPIQMLARITTDEVDLHGRTIPRGARVVLVYGAANHDPRRWQEPERLLLDREQQRNLAFGEGIHHCLGAPLARLEGRVGLRAFVERFPDYSVDGKPDYQHKHNARGLSRLRASLGARVGAGV